MILTIISILCYLSIFYGLFLSLKSLYTRHKNEYQMESIINQNPKFCILIPARDESNVIEGILQSIQTQTLKINLKDVYIIIETKEDPTYEIAKKYNSTVIIRKHLEKKSKGYALQEGIEWLEKKNIYYDAYFIFDADNILDKNYLKEMQKDYLKGYAISTGYRNFKNGDDSVIAAASGLTYCFINSWRNKNGLKYKKNVILSGTGFFIHGSYIKKWKTYPFHSLTEDVELSYYACLNGLSTNYNENACFYDELPKLYSETVKQRVRWIKGFLKTWLEHRPKLKRRLKENPKNYGSVQNMYFGISSVLFIVFGFLILLITWLIKPIQLLIMNFAFSWPIFFFSLFTIWTLYFFLVFMTYLILKKEKDKLNLSMRMKKKVLWYHPIFLVSYIHVFFKAILKKNVSWEKINHGA